MIEIPSLRPETRYGMPTADLLLFNRQYIVGYSYLFRQPRWAMQIIDDSTRWLEDDEFDRLDNFREDLRVPEMFRSTLADYKGSGYDRGHLINSADRKSRKIVNSETFLLSNICPQLPGFNRGVWLELEDEIRGLAAREEYVEVYTICGPLWGVGEKIDLCGDIPVPHCFFKSVLAEKANAGGKSQLEMWTFCFNGPEDDLPLALVATLDVERWTGLQLWDRLRGKKAEKMKGRKGRMW